MEPTSQTVDLRDLIWRVRRYSWFLFLPPIAALCLASVYYRTSPVIYQSQVIVSLADQANLGPALQPMVNADRDRGSSGQRMALVDRKIRSRAFLFSLVDRLGLLSDGAIVAQAEAASRRYPNITPQEFASRIAGAAIDRRIRVVPMEGGFVGITATGATAESAQRLAGTITDLLIEESRRSSLERVQARGEFSQDQVAVYQERLRQSENSLQAYQESILKRSLQNTPVNETNVGDARSLLHAIDQEIDQTRDRIDVAKLQWTRDRPDEAPPTLASRDSDELQRRLSAAEISLAQASISAPRPDAAGQDTQSNISALRQSLFLEFQSLAAALPGDLSDAARSAIAGIATDRGILRSLQNKRERMSAWIDQFVRGVENSPKEKMELARLQNAVESNRELLGSFQHEVQSTRVSEALASSAMGLQLTVEDPPQFPLHPSSPDPLRIFGAALLLGPLLSAGVVVAFEKFSMSIRTVEQAEMELGKSVLGTVPRIEGLTRRGSYIARNWAILSIVVVLLLTGLFHGLNATIMSERAHQRSGTSPTAP
ncbi:MAG TPA: hypothetical protein VF363_06815 [Candidatus Eisenbacteria bacterium]